MSKKRLQEYNDDTKVKIDEYNEKDRYSVYDSTEEYKKQLDKEKRNFTTGKPLLFDVKDAVLEYPVKVDKDGNKITKTDEHGNEIFVRDDDRQPYIKLTRRGIGKKAVCNVPLYLFIDMLENLQSALLTTDKDKAKKIEDVLDTVFPKEKVFFGTFDEDGDRKLIEDKFFYLGNIGLVFRSYPILNEDGTPSVIHFVWVDDKGTHEIDLCYYHNDSINGAQLGIK